MKNLTNEELIQKHKKLQDQLNEVISEIKARNLGWKYLLDQGLKIQAVIAYREEKKVSLRDAKDFIDTHLLESAEISN